MLIFICITTVCARDTTILGEEIAGNYFTKSKSLYGIPLTTRSTEVAFPDVCVVCSSLSNS